MHYNLKKCGNNKFKSNLKVVNFVKKKFMFFLCVFISFILSINVCFAAQKKVIQNPKLYTNNNLNISLNYPSDWIQNKLYTDRYEGKSGFFQVSALKDSNLSIDKIIEYEVNSITKPYGSTPKTTKFIFPNTGTDAALIYPSEDQLPELKGQSAFILKYKKPVIINNTPYTYFILWADKNNMNDIYKTVKFIK